MLAMYHQQESFGLKASNEILSQAIHQPEQAIFLLECLTLCIDFQAGFLNSISKDENFSSVISNTFYANIDAIATRASRESMLKRLLGTFILFMSKIISNTKLRRNKAFTKLVSEFISYYILGNNQSIYRLFIDRDEYKNDIFEMSIRGQSSRVSLIEAWKQDSVLEEKIKNLCFYNYVLSSYILIISQ